ncbi:DUF397 domain-containing protein [Actinocorallia sp. API 0066]|uniref:DUF397 domain-containing protein n=1 Tax=Actinocorallia sp. API 0066 TaxID=2896846 RepID=UPI001E2CEFCC|nr:DUF397 domain-containing protein [Actinocorallia sp. API 0066]MCD0448215.1 DUF397 domain-containing protein [Actinocorallia sp. API 0066]
MSEHRIERYGDGEDSVVIEFIPSEEVPDEIRKDNKIFLPGTQAIVMSNAAEPDGPRLYFTEGEWEAFVLGVKDGEFDDLLEDLPEDLPQDAEPGPSGQP